MHCVSVSTLAFDGHDFTAACAGVAEAGGKLVEPAFVASYGSVSEDSFIASNALKMRDAMRSAGVGCDVLSAHVDMGSPLAPEQLERRLDFAAELGARRLITNTGAAGTEVRFCNNVEVVARKAQQVDVLVCLENPGAGSNLFSSGIDMLAWSQRLDHSHIGFNYDCGNVFTATREAVDPSADIDHVLPFVAHLHLKDFRSDATGWRICPIGQGVIDYQQLLTRVASSRPDLSLSVEMPLRMSRPGRGEAVIGPALPLDAVIDSVRQSLEFVTTRLGTADNI